jgi:gliding motility-associated-like protein
MTHAYKWIQFVILFSLTAFVHNPLWSQARIQVRVTTVQVLNNVDCDGFLTGNSDFVVEYIATDNTLGNSNNNPVLFGFLGDFNHTFNNGNNGPWTLNPNFTFFDYEYVCPTDVPTNIRIDWQGYENDAPTNYDLTGGAFSEVRTGAQLGNIAVPATPGTATQTFQANGTSGCGTQTYIITIEVIRTAITVNYLPDAVCAAPNIPLNTTLRYAWCPTASLEGNEPHRGEVSANGSVWFAFVAPASGEVEITTDLSGTDIGTYIEIYHAADGNSCATGVQIPSLALIKNKFDYLSHVEFSDGTDFLGIDPEAEITLDACDPVNPFSYQKLHPGQTYYVQLTADNAGARGYYEVRVNDLGGSSPPNVEDLPCTSPLSTIGNTAISSSAGSTATRTLNFGCAYDGGNDFGETGGPHVNSNPNDYHAYDYNHPAYNNGTMNESVWTNFTAPNSGRIVFETDYQSAIYGENSAFFGYDARFAPGVPADFSCANLSFIEGADGGLNGLFGNSQESAIIRESCLEPGYKYFAMVDPSDNLTPLSTQNIKTWIHDPSVADPLQNPPGNDILCLAILDTLYRIPVRQVGQNLPFQAVAGTNVRGCIERLAGEPNSNSNPTLRADQTVWHYFVVPPSGVVEIRLRAYIGMQRLNFNIFELLNGTSCYGGLAPATFTQDGTRLSTSITPVYSGSTDFNGTTISICCLVPGDVYALQLDGGSPGDQGQYIVEYIDEIEVYAGDSQYETMYGDTIRHNSNDTGYICFGDTLYPSIALDLFGLSTTSIPGCLDTGYVIHNASIIPSPLAGSGFTYIDSLRFGSRVFVNDGNGSGTFGNPLFNSVYFVSALADNDTTWGQLICPSASIENGAPVVFLQQIQVSSSYNQNNCFISFTPTGGLPAYNGSLFTYVITNTQGDTITGSTANGVTVNFQIPTPDVYTIVVTDGASCSQTITINATTCFDLCVTNPVAISPSPIDSTVYTCFPGGDSATATINIAGGYPSANSSVYTITVSGSTAASNGTYTLAGSATTVPFSFTIRDGDTWTVVVTDTSGCTDSITATFTYDLVNCPDFCDLNPVTATSGYNCFSNGSALVEITMGGGLPSIDGSNYSVTVNGSTVFGQTFNNAQVPGTIGGTGLISFLVNDGDNWTAIVRDNYGCSDTLTGTYVFNATNCPNLCIIMPVVINPDPIDDSVYECNPDGSATVTLFFSGGVPAASGGSYNVAVSGSTVAGANGNFTSGLGTYSFLANENDNWRVIITDANNCSDTAVGTVNFNPITLSVSNYTCDINGTAEFTLTISGGNPAIDGSDYLLTVTGITTGGNVFNLPVAGTIGASTDYVITVADGDIWQIFLNDGQNCTASVSDTFVWNATNCSNICNGAGYTNVLINGGTDSISYDCDGNGNAMLNLEFTGGLPALGGVNYGYIAEITINGNTVTENITGTGGLGTYVLNLQDGDVWQVILNDGLGCGFDTLNGVFNSVTAVAQTDITFEVFVGEPAQLIGSNSTGNITNYAWTPIATINNPTVANTFALPIVTTTFVLEVSDAFDCSDRDSVRVRVGACVPDHAGFTPNADGVNDLWVIPCLGLLPGDVEVYNRWGQLVYRKENYDNSWNGTHFQTNQDLPDATYYYVIKVTYPMYTNQLIYKGTVSIIR